MNTLFNPDNITPLEVLQWLKRQRKSTKLQYSNKWDSSAFIGHKLECGCMLTKYIRHKGLLHYSIGSYGYVRPSAALFVGQSVGQIKWHDEFWRRAGRKPDQGLTISRDKAISILNQLHNEQQQQSTVQSTN